MNPNLPLSPDDPRVTAYALGELEGAERAAVEAAVQRDPALQEVVAEIRSVAGELEASLAAEPLPAADLPVPSVATYPISGDGAGKVLRFPYFLVAGLAAAAFAVLVAVRDSESPVGPKKERVIQYEVNLQAPTEPPEAAFAASSTQASVPAPEAAVAQAPFPVDAASPATPAAFDSSLADVANATLREQAVRPVAPLPVQRQRELSYAQASEPQTLEAAKPIVTSAPGATLGMMSTDVNQRNGARLLRTDLRERDLPRPLPARAEPAVEHYAAFDENPFLPAAGNPLSTFSIDVDTAAYANVRRLLERGQRPPRDAVRIEELVNYFPYGYRAPAPDAEHPLAAHIEVASAPWAPEHRLVRVGLKGRDLAAGARAPANLVFLVDVSGSMATPEKLPLVKESLRLLLSRLQPDDRVAIVTYAGVSGLALPSTPVRQSREILAALDALAPGGTTNGASGIHLAYDVAKANFVDGGINRVILCTDGDFNVGVTSTGDLGRLIGEKAASGVYLTALGFGMGNYRDDTLERLADRGNGQYGYIDSASEARKLLADEVNGTLAVVARDVKVQVEFNPVQVQAYRLIGYENRLLRKEEFNNDSVDAGELGAGQTVTALYEVVPAGSAPPQVAAVDPLKYQPAAPDGPARSGARRADVSEELLTVKVRYQPPAGGASRRVEFAIVDSGTSWEGASSDYRFASAAAGFGLVLRESPHRGSATLAQVLTWAQKAAAAEDPGGYRREFLGLVRRAMDVIGE